MKKLYEYLKRNNMTYAQYLSSDHWKDVRNRFWKSKIHHGKCYACGSSKLLQVHHKSYTRLGRENINDLCLLCDNCHLQAHKLLKLGKGNTNIWNAARKLKLAKIHNNKRLLTKIY